MTKREQMIALAVGGALGIFALDRFVVSPLMAAQDNAARLVAAEQKLLDDETRLIQLRSANERKWQEHKQKGLLSDPQLAVNQLATHLNSWAAEQNLQVGTMSMDPTPQPVNKPGGRAGEREPGFMRVGCKFSVTGGMGQLANFLNRIQTAEIPIRISALSITTKSEGQDNQEMSLTVSTIILSDGKPIQANAQQRQTPAASQPGGSTSAPASRRGT